VQSYNLLTVLLPQ